MQPGSKTQCERGNWIAENGLPVLACRCGPWFVNSETVKVVKLCPRPQIVDASLAAWRPGGAAAALAAAAACRRASADHRPGDSEGEAEAGGEEAAMAAKRIGGSGARGWGGS